MYPPDQRQQQALDQHALNEAQLAGAQRLANAGLTQASGNPRQRSAILIRRSIHGADCGEQQDQSTRTDPRFQTAAE